MTATSSLAVGMGIPLQPLSSSLGATDLALCEESHALDLHVNWQSPIGAAYQCVFDEATGESKCVRRGTNGGAARFPMTRPWFIQEPPSVEPNLYATCSACVLQCGVSSGF